MSEKRKYMTFDDYLYQQTTIAQIKLKLIRAYILEAVPEVEELFNYGIPAFSLIKGGKREEQIMIAAFKNHIGFYPHPTTIKHFDLELKEYDKGKGSIQFPLDKDIPKELVIKMVRYRKRCIDEKRSWKTSNKDIILGILGLF